MTKHEIIACERCQNRMECKANSFTKCQCSEVQLTHDEIEHIAESYDGCLCAACLLELQQAYQQNLSTTIS